ncbi:MAG: hypothetical protein WD025_01775, partial [Bacteriovoracaceae bacterium]
TVGSYDAADIFEDSSLNKEKKGVLRRFWNGIKYKIYNAGINLGISNRIKYSFDYEFPEIDSGTIKSVKVKKIFFALENCPKNDEECRLRNEKDPVTFMLLDKFFLNLSVIQPHDDISFIDSQDPIISSKEFENASLKAFSSRPAPFDSLVNGDGEVSEKVFYDVNLAKFHNTKHYRRNQEVADELSNIFLLRLNRDLSKGEKIDLIRHFKLPKYQGVIQDFSLIGHNIYLELVDTNAYEEFFKILGSSVSSVADLGIDSFEACNVNNCANLKTISSNLVPMLEKSNHIKFDTYFSIRKLEMNDFRYNGFVELEIKLDLGI